MLVGSVVKDPSAVLDYYVTTPLPKGSGFVRNACVYNHYVSPNRLSPSPKIS